MGNCRQNGLGAPKVVSQGVRVPIFRQMRCSPIWEAARGDIRAGTPPSRKHLRPSDLSRSVVGKKRGTSTLPYKAV